MRLVAVGHDAVVVLAELLGDRRVGHGQRDAHRQVVHLLQVLGIDRREAGGAEQPGLRVEDAVDRVDDVVGRERLAVVELDPLAQADRPLLRRVLRELVRQAALVAADLELVLVVVGDERLPARGQAGLVGLGDDALAVDDVARAAARHAEAEVPAALGRTGRGRAAARRRRRRSAAAAAGREAAGEHDGARTHQKVAPGEASAASTGTVAGLVHHRRLLPWGRSRSGASSRGAAPMIHRRPRRVKPHVHTLTAVHDTNTWSGSWTARRY